VYFKIHTRKLSCFRAVDQIETFDHDFIIQGDRVRMDNVVYYPPHRTVLTMMLASCVMDILSSAIQHCDPGRSKVTALAAQRLA
jgi:hypothetical protein